MEFEYSSAFYSSCFPNEHFDSKLFQRALDSFVPAVNSLAVARTTTTSAVAPALVAPGAVVASESKKKSPTTMVVSASQHVAAATKKQKKSAITSVTTTTANSIKKQKKTSSNKKVSSAIVVAATQEDKWNQNLSRTAQDRLVWTEELHLLFLQVISELGDKAKPKEILQKMGVDGLTRGNVSSHLQKYKQRKERKVAPKKKTRATKVENEFHSKGPSNTPINTTTSTSSNNNSSNNSNNNNGNNGSNATANTLSPTVIARSPTPVSVEEQSIDSTPSPISAPMEYTEQVWFEAPSVAPAYALARRASFSRALFSDSDAIFYPPAPSPYFNSFSEYLATPTSTADDYFTGYSNYYNEF